MPNACVGPPTTSSSTDGGRSRRGHVDPPQRRVLDVVGEAAPDGLRHHARCCRTTTRTRPVRASHPPPCVAFRVRRIPGRPTGPNDPDPRAPYAPTMDRDERLEELMSAVVSLSSTLDTATVLERLVEAGCHLTGARYGALGVLGEHGGLVEFVHRGIDDETAARIGPLPTGRGVLGHLSTSPEAIRLHEICGPPGLGRLPGAPPADAHVPRRPGPGAWGGLRQPVPHREARRRRRARWTSRARDEQVAVALASAAGVAVGHARAYRRAREHELWLEAAAACSEALTSGIPRADALAVVRARVEAVAEASVGHAARRPPARARRTTSSATPRSCAGCRTASTSASQDPSGCSPCRCAAPSAGSRRSRRAGPDPRATQARSSTCRASRGSPSSSRSPWTSPRRRPTAPGWRCSRSASASPATCTTW